ncbi:uncharacterized protein LOC107044981 [Diachasma alloeum]|uniref:uncharacterized protein LOC107044981 n=1 Tax=Diachasma alloeum TaxID=454923 RepID=UPI000738246F|nr:uncharacterized protein LOC107044981 [Diachasma alloeum]
MSDPDTVIEKQAVDNQQDARGAAAQPTKTEPPRSTIPKAVISETEDEANIPSTQRIQHIKTRYSEVIGLPAAGLTVHQEILLRQLKFRVESITHIYKELTTTIMNDEDVTVEELDGQKERLETYWTAATKEQSIKLVSKLKGRLSKKTQPASNSPGQEHPDKLKRLDLKAFDGTPSQWKEFRDLFTSLVGSKSTIAPVEKLIRLKSSLRGSPATLISTLDINDQNYEKAWEKLKAKYDDPRLVAQYLFNRILKLPKITKGTQEKLNHNTAAAVESLDQLREVVGLSDANLIEQMIAHLLRRSLDAETLKQWELKLGDSRDFPSLKEFVGFVEACGRGINAGSELHATQETNIADRKSLKKKKSSYAAATQQDSNAERLLPRNCCAMCKEKHFIAECQKFRELPPVKRTSVVISNGLCFSCLGPHRKTKCFSTKRCQQCQGNHHTLIHGGSEYTNAPPRTRRDLESTDVPASAKVDPGQSTDKITTRPSTSTATVNLNNQRTSENAETTQQEADQQSVLLATAQVKVKSPKGFISRARVLIDQGSEVSFISEKLVHQLHLTRTTETLELIAIGGVTSGHTRRRVSVTLQAINGPQQVKLNAHVLKKLTAILPSFSCESVDIGSLENLQLADQQYLQPGPIDIIIGADNYGQIIKDEVVKSKQSRLVGQRTAFGWILTGPINCSSRSRRVSLSAVRESSHERLLELLQRFWVQEELSVQRSDNSELSQDELECEKHFRSTHSRDSTGRYIVRLPLKTSAEALGESKFKASRQLKSTVSKLNNNQEYAQLYKEFINEYEALGHMQRAPDSPEPTPACYLPHHGVLREKAITTMLRVVFNGSSPSSSGMSLNDILYPGRKLQINAMDVLTWMRKDRLVFGTDIVKMFRQIRVHRDDWDLQRILWIDDNQQQISYQLTTVTYGLNCSPWLSLRHRLVFGTDIVKMFRQIRVHRDDWDLQRILWMDDNQPQISYQLTTVTYGLNCSPWLSLRVLQQLAEDEGHRFPAAVETITRGRYVDDIYGGAESAAELKEIVWQLQGLCQAGGFALQKWSSNCPRLLHELGLSTEEAVIQFEESVTKVLGMCWHQSSDTFRYKSRDFNTQTITKRVVSSEIAQIFDPLGFIAPVVVKGKILLQDLWKLKYASTVAMSAVVYIRTRNINEPASTVMVCAKTKVAPIKRMTIPRLELTAALLLTQLVASTQRMLQLDHAETHLWSDSAVTLAWIRSHTSRWKDFVHNRVVKIQETPECHLETRPEWINQDPEEWPQSTIDAPAMDIPKVAKEAKPARARSVAPKVNELAELLTRYSSMARLLAVTATINRAIDRFRRLPTPPGPILSTRELNEARLFWVKITQNQYFVSALRVLQRNQQLPRGHQLAKLTPTLDELNIMRLGGRLKNSDLHPEETHPIILPRQSRFTTLMIEEAHRRTLHGGTQLTLAYTRQRYWILGGRGTVRAYILRCAICTRHRGKQA